MVPLIDMSTFSKFFPLIFREEAGDQWRALDCPKGWIAVLTPLCEGLEQLASGQRKAGNTLLRIVEIKEKMGELRVYISPRSEEAVGLISSAREKSTSICMICGKPGVTIQKDGWFLTCCPTHAIE